MGRGLLRVCLSAVEGLGLWDAKRLTLLEKLDLAMAKHDAGGWLNLPLSFGCALNALPPISSCQWCVEEVANAFCVRWALGDLQRARALLSLWLKVALCLRRFSSQPPFPFSCCLCSLSNRSSPKTWSDSYQSHARITVRNAGAKDTLQSCSQVANWRCLPARHISTCRCPRILVLWLLRYCFTCTFPSQASLAG